MLSLWFRSPSISLLSPSYPFTSSSSIPFPSSIVLSILLSLPPTFTTHIDCSLLPSLFLFEEELFDITVHPHHSLPSLFVSSTSSPCLTFSPILRTKDKTNHSLFLLFPFYTFLLSLTLPAAVNTDARWREAEERRQEKGRDAWEASLFDFRCLCANISFLVALENNWYLCSAIMWV